ncbi:hypothetical protein [Metabacillus litoralis]|uniref:hypothetical protein n=1 Tax=Metabacillus litoralis TaxID=152268 RepID=UPI000EF5CC1A|nr:hypothetical protein [Metabacillus litoralis]
MEGLIFLIKKLQLVDISLEITFDLVENVATKLIKDSIGKDLPIRVEADDDKDELLIRVHIDDRSLSDDEFQTLDAIGFADDQPYRSADRVIKKILGHNEYRILPFLGKAMS